MRYLITCVYLVHVTVETDYLKSDDRHMMEGGDLNLEHERVRWIEKEKRRRKTISEAAESDEEHEEETD